MSERLEPGNGLWEKIFERFSRGNTRAKGSGLGLYLVKTIVESHGGRVWVEDRMAGSSRQGSRFVVRLPAGEAGESTG
ncbi:sensor histidine kinase [Methanocella sp. MCL-LM]|uniref:sensor histidine kinase n=1 Tax=Methanocella sp. MCL-LM TaxID=3412035 RepID=UPI003C776D1D